MSMFEELKRRNVFRVAIGYAITAWLLLQLVDLVLENVNAPDWVMQVFMLALLIGFPLAVFFAWAFEMTPEGVKRESEIDRSQSITPTTGRKLDRAIIVVLAIAVVFLMYKQFGNNEKTAPIGSESFSQEVLPQTAGPDEARETPAPVASVDDKSIAVLPLVNRSVQAEDAFFAEGLHDELLTQLSRVSTLRVISRTSVMGYAGTTKRIPEIAEELGVATLLEGGVQRSGNRVRINVQLIDAATDEHLWAEVYDRELTADNLFDIQSDITRAIANALQAVLTGEEQQTIEQKPTENVEAYAYYLRGKAESKGYGRDLPQIDITIGFFQSAIDLDPQFAAAYAALAINWTERFWGTDKTGKELMHALDALQHAQALAPDSVETLNAEGYYHYWGHLDYASAIIAFDRVLQREPGNYPALLGKAFVLRRLGQPDESIVLLEKMLLLDPLDLTIPADVGYTLLRAGQIEAAEVMLRRSITLSPDSLLGRFTLGELYLMNGELEPAWQMMQPVTSESASYFSDLLLLIARAQGNSERVDQVLDVYGSASSQSIGPVFARALVYLDRDDQDKLQELLSVLQADLKIAERMRPGEESTLSSRIILHALQKDQARLRTAVAAFYSGVKPDALRIVENRTIPIAYAIAGDSEALLDFLEKLVEQYGPWEFYYFDINPSFDEIRNLPRFQALDKQYRQWLEQQQ